MTVAGHFLDGQMLAEVTTMVNTNLTSLLHGHMLPFERHEGLSMRPFDRHFDKISSVRRQAQQTGRSG